MYYVNKRLWSIQPLYFIHWIRSIFFGTKLKKNILYYVSKNMYAYLKNKHLKCEHFK